MVPYYTACAPETMAVAQQRTPGATVRLIEGDAYIAA